MTVPCPNCGATTEGRYCAECGQPKRASVPTLRRLLGDVFGELFELDSRLWRSLGPLVRRPGLLTGEYVAGRRARYVSPFRMYLGMSLLFFIVAGASDESLESSRQAPAAEAASETAADADPLDCEFEDLETGVAWLDSPETGERLRRTCRGIEADGGRSFGRAVGEHFPLLFLALVPVLAGVMRLLYWGGSHYVAHLIFLAHVHSFMFLILTAGELVALGAGLIGPELVGKVLEQGASGWSLVYPFLAMRRVYRETRLRTAVKYTLLLLASVLGLSVVAMIGVAGALLTVV